MKDYLKAAAIMCGVAFGCLCLSWLGEAVRSADLPSYKEVGILLLIVAASIYAVVSFYLLFGRRK